MRDISTRTHVIVKALPLLFAVIVAGTNGCQPTNYAAVTAATIVNGDGLTGHAFLAPENAWNLVHNGALLVDVRSPEEYQSGSFPEALNVPYDTVRESRSHFGNDLDRPIILFCRSGRRAGLAQSTLASLGYRSVFNAGSYESLLTIRGE